MKSVNTLESSPIKSARTFLYDDMPNITYGTNSAVFVIGAPRSGKSILGRLIRKYFNINFGTESQFIVPFYKRLHKIENLSDPKNMDRLIRQVAEERCFARWKRQFGFSLDLDSLKQEIAVPTFRGLLDAIFGQFSRFAGRTRWADASARYTLDLPLLEAFYPEAQYVHVIRDGRDVAGDLQYTPYGPKNYLQAAFYWRHYVMSALNFGEQICSSRFHEVRYEALILDPVNVMTRLARFFQIDEGHQQVIARIKQQIHEDLQRDNRFKWKKVMPPSRIEMFEKGAGDLLQTLGYEVLFSNAKKPSFLEKASSCLDNAFRCYTNKVYVKNRLYKLRVRFQRP